MIYCPDKWIIIKVNDDLYKVIGGWHGGYLQGDSWRMNSGISSVKLNDFTYEISGFSGSTYMCSKSRYGITMLMSSIVERCKKLHPELVVLTEKEAEDYLDNLCE